MKIRGTLSALLLAVGLTGNAIAGNGAYIGASIGQSSADETCDDLIALGATSCDDTDTGWKVFGGYNFTENFALEGGWVDLGEMTASGAGYSGAAEVDGIVLGVKGTLPLTNGFGIFGKLGVIFWDAEGHVIGPGVNVSASDDGSDFTFGFGAEYSITEQFGVRAEWERFDIDGEDVDLLSVGAVLKF